MGRWCRCLEDNIQSPANFQEKAVAEQETDSALSCLRRYYLIEVVLDRFQARQIAQLLDDNDRINHERRRGK
jgi:hypothetical protein